MTLRSRRLTFALANTAAVLSALYVAFALDLERPYWAMLSVFIVAKPISGAVRSKAVYRLAGTVVGAAMGVALVPPLVQAPELLCLAISAWMSLCIYVSLLDRSPRSYAFLLAGYTAAVIAFSVVDRPETLFQTAVARVEEISLGIVCATLAHSVFFPRSVESGLGEQVWRTIRATANRISAALERPFDKADLREHQRLAEWVTGLHALQTHLNFETSGVPRIGGIVGALQGRLALLATHLTSVQAALAALHRQSPMSPALSGYVERASHWARALADSRSTAGVCQPVPLPPLELAEEPIPVHPLLERASALRIAMLLETLEEIRSLGAALENSALPPAAVLNREPGSHDRRALHSDRGLAAVSALAAVTACLVASAFWIALAWPEGGVAAQFAAIGCSLTATLDQPAKLLRATVFGIMMSLPFGAIYVFAVLPGLDGFPSLALVLAPVLLLLSLGLAFERLEGAFLVLAVGFSGSLALQPSYQADFAAFVNANAAEIVGLLLAAMTVVLVRTLDPRWNAVRISRAGWRAVSRLARGGERDFEAWTLAMFDRVGLVAARLGNEDLASPDFRLIDPLRDLRVGLNVDTLNRTQCSLPPDAQLALQRVRDDVSSSYDRIADSRDWGKHDLRTSIDIGIQFLLNLPSSVSRRDGLSALAFLRLDLAQDAEFARMSEVET